MQATRITRGTARWAIMLCASTPTPPPATMFSALPGDRSAMAVSEPHPYSCTGAAEVLRSMAERMEATALGAANKALQSSLPANALTSARQCWATSSSDVGASRSERVRSTPPLSAVSLQNSSLTSNRLSVAAPAANVEVCNPDDLRTASMPSIPPSSTNFFACSCAWEKSARISSSKVMMRAAVQASLTSSSLAALVPRATARRSMGMTPASTNSTRLRSFFRQAFLQRASPGQTAGQDSSAKVSIVCAARSLTTS
mmetsp:Transcript_22706/g.53706  ORF Transcript_22706/g.53706 Transcript_22706/m.53706 type:complete len:257 (+) Transcript_22706:964-1734(+)